MLVCDGVCLCLLILSKIVCMHLSALTFVGLFKMCIHALVNIGQPSVSHCGILLVVILMCLSKLGHSWNAESTHCVN